mgnify:CR=1 FL=1
MKDTNQYCHNLFEYNRRICRVVEIGNTPLGGIHPIRVQSMTTTNTMDTESTVLQSIRMIEAGSEYVRITAPGIKEAENLYTIKKKLEDAGYTTPIIADIHFTPNAAEIAARYIEKVRINPGNYFDRKKFQMIDYSDDSYNFELDKIHTRFSPLIKICKEYGTAMRIGTNHGSLSDRIMSRYGDSPLGMVESALEFIRICRDQNYHDIVLSMKSSNPFVMVEANRLLVNRMQQEDMDYPLHLGVTEAGEGEDGRVKSAIGIGSLLEDGVGDTIRVSLTEEPENELPAALELANKYNKRIAQSQLVVEPASIPVDPFRYQKRHSVKILNFGGSEPPRVISSLGAGKVKSHNYLWQDKDIRSDYLHSYELSQLDDFSEPVGVFANYPFENKYDSKVIPLISWDKYIANEYPQNRSIGIMVSTAEIDVDKLRSCKNSIIILSSKDSSFLHAYRKVFVDLFNSDIDLPVVIRLGDIQGDHISVLTDLSINIGGLLIDGFVDGIWLDNPSELNLKLVYSIFQTTRLRISRTEFISCPSCGRTLFDLQETSEKIRQRTNHLKGLKIGIMGCIVNGPGEMADADYGYVGTGVGVVSLYRGMEVIKKNIPSRDAVDGLIEIIKNDGKWIPPDID